MHKLTGAVGGIGKGTIVTLIAAQNFLNTPKLLALGLPGAFLFQSNLLS